MDFDTGESTDDLIEFTELYKIEREAKNRALNKINVKVEDDGTVTLSGIDYREFSSLICDASLYLYDSEKKPSSSMREYFKLRQALMEGAKPSWAGEEECLRSNAIDDLIYRINCRALVDAIEKNKDAALRAHNKKYSALEQFYFKYISDTRWKLIRFGLALKKIWQNNGYNAD